MYKILTILLLLFSFSSAKIHITLTLPVQKYFFEKIAKNNYLIHIVESRKDKFDLNDSEFMNRLAFSKIYYTLGLEKEKKYINELKKLNKYLIIKEISKDIVNKKENPYFWMDPLLNRKYAKAILDETIRNFPHKKAEFEENYKLLVNELDRNFLEIKRRLDNSGNLNYFAYKPYWHYYAKRFKVHIFYREKKFTHLSEIPELIKFGLKKDIKKVIITKGTNYDLARSLSSHINADIVENDINSYDWKSNIFSLTRGLSKK